ncbi:alkaline phosphatase [Conexibacter sp. SYSU D00693]|uniref:alkaline phosphatase D family protein n=1 Tax=Conexibacter sp. SYSU D00693 TaxID=2812560 RepID=UPI00196B286F|nr:alkaline phosphatase D family protein [Conexibacter sp. SYSU D00693]
MQSRARRLTRREITAAGAGLALAAASVPDAWADRLLQRTPRVGPGRFLDGVASGEPSTDAVTFWSRLSTEHQRSGAELVVAKDEGMSQTVARAVVPTTRSVDGSLKVRVDGLEPDTLYWYRWRSADGTSDLGRTKTAKPADSQEQVRLAYSSCQNWPEGFFNGHVDAAKLEPLDLYLFLGDYTYEYGPTAGSVAGRDDPAPSVDLQTYRDKLRLYRSDPGLRELHRLHPIAHIWDDHEVADNYSDNAPRPSDLQRAAGYQASFEWLPRVPQGGERYRLYRSLPLGGQCEVFLLDQRQYRTGDGDGQARQLLGRQQMDWLKDALRKSTARWKVIANQVMFVPLGVGGAGINDDQWDGYPAEQAELRALLGDAPISNTMFVTGDIHTYFTAEVLRHGSSGPPVATEYVGGSISSTGFPALAGLESTAITAANPWIAYTNGADHGYAKVDLGTEAATTTYRVGPLDTPGAPQRDLKVYRQPAGTNRFEQVGGENKPGELPPNPAARSLRSDRAATPELAARRRKHERLERAARERTEAKARAATRRKKARTS